MKLTKKNISEALKGYQYASESWTNIEKVACRSLAFQLGFAKKTNETWAHDPVVSIEEYLTKTTITGKIWL